MDNGINKTYGEAAPVNETEYDSSDGELFGDVGDYSDFEVEFITFVFVLCNYVT